ncbi:MAG TPA: ATP-binding protein [Chitinophagales bacterium]|nr:response regulator [Chitinophagales bacterium]HMV14323.1 ATP-binding protein [Chitinophagales bacterium]HMX59723.1 ATP-binding protein [Chitinophagales bacterium]HMZ33090.1 ATP-binding protein [Chitinophagales bacterium]HNA38314.1 ATP-binding protein [Chitinophagales bacterium]
MLITTIEKAETFIVNLKRSDNWISNDELFSKLNASYKLITKHNRYDLLPDLGVNFALYYLDLNNIEQALIFTEIAKTNAINCKNDIRLLDAIGLQFRIQKTLGNLEEAQLIINEQIDVAYRVNDMRQLAAVYQNQATLFHKQRLKTDTIEAYEKSLEFIRKSDNLFYNAQFHIGYAGILLDFSEPELAKIPLQQGFNIAVENNYLAVMAIAYSNFGLLYELQNDEINSIASYQEALKIYTALKQLNHLVVVKIMMADACVSFNRIEEAELLLKDAIEQSEKLDLKYNLIGIYQTLSSLLEKKGDFKNALEYYKKLNSTKEAYLSAESDKRIRNLELNKKIDLLRFEKDVAEKMANIKHDFLANMSHEIRTPINSILGICYLLQQQDLNPVQFDYIKRLKRSGENLLGIINDVLDISKIESGKMELNNEAFKLIDLSNDIFTSLEPKANAKEIKLKIRNNFPEDLFVNADKIRLYQVLLNIVSNAIKFTDNGSVTLTIKIENIDEKQYKLIFVIADTGIGIDKEKINLIFERYEQADKTIKNKFGGTGLGLSISKKIVQLMNGTISAKSKVNKGTEFTVCLPFKHVAKHVNKMADFDVSTLSSKLDNKYIIIADDNEENRAVAKDILLKFNPSLKIIEAIDGNEVIALLFKKIPDIIFMDLDMPNLNGIDTTMQIRKNKKYNKVKIVGNTASLMTLSKDEINEIGFDEFIQKPFEPEKLLLKISELFC